MSRHSSPMLLALLIVCHVAGLMGPLDRSRATFTSSSSSELLCGRSFRTEWITMPVDHFNFELQNSSFALRVLINDDDLSKVDPVMLFYTGNEGDIALFANNTGFMCELADELGAMLVFAEHRYFGQSMPFGTLEESYKRDKIGYLSVDQAMADFALVITTIKTTLGIEGAPVITFGGSYGGMLSAWFRIKYPHIVNGAIAASAPILQFTGVTESTVFNDIIFATFESSQKGCGATIKAMFDLMAKRTLEDLSRSFRTCQPVTKLSDVVDWIVNGLTYEAMVDYPFPANFIEPLPAWPVNGTCALIGADACSHPDPIDCFIDGLDLYFNHTGTAGDCNDLSGGTTPALGTDGWDYLACTSMVMPLSSGPGSMFPLQEWDLEQYNQGCQSRWGVTPDSAYAVRTYGGDKLGAASNIVFSNGNLDPWSGGGVRKTVSKSVVAVTIQGGAHHLDLRASDPVTDSASLCDARRIHRQHINKWIEEARAPAELFGNGFSIAME